MRQTPASALRVEELERLLDQVSKKLDKLERMYFNKGEVNDSGQGRNDVLCVQARRAEVLDGTTNTQCGPQT